MAGRCGARTCGWAQEARGRAAATIVRHHYLARAARAEQHAVVREGERADRRAARAGSEPSARVRAELGLQLEAAQLEQSHKPRGEAQRAQLRAGLRARGAGAQPRGLERDAEARALVRRAQPRELLRAGGHLGRRLTRGVPRPPDGGAALLDTRHQHVAARAQRHPAHGPRGAAAEAR